MDVGQSRRFYRQGYLKIPGVVPAEKVFAARREMCLRMGSAISEVGVSVKTRKMDGLVEATRSIFVAGEGEVFIDLFNKTALKKILEKALGSKVLPVRSAQLATLFPSDTGDATNEYGYLDKDTPHYGWTGHLDGLWNGGTAVPRAGTRLRGERLKAWNASKSTNGVNKTNPEFNANIMNFTALVGIALSDQMSLGSGNLGVLRGGHRHMERFFRDQVEKGGPLGPDGPGWERENRKAPNGRGLVHYPRVVRNLYTKNAAQSADGELWPKPDFMKLKPGDAVIVHSLTPHSATRVFGVEPRFMVYFRCVSAKRPEPNLRIYPEALCDSLLEWRGVKRNLTG